MMHRHKLAVRFDRASKQQHDSIPESPEISRKYEHSRTKRIHVRYGRKGRK